MWKATKAVRALRPIRLIQVMRGIRLRGCDCCRSYGSEVNTQIQMCVRLYGDAGIPDKLNKPDSFNNSDQSNDDFHLLQTLHTPLHVANSAYSSNNPNNPIYPTNPTSSINPTIPTNPTTPTPSSFPRHYTHPCTLHATTIRKREWLLGLFGLLRIHMMAAQFVSLHDTPNTSTTFDATREHVCFCNTMQASH